MRIVTDRDFRLQYREDGALGSEHYEQGALRTWLRVDIRIPACVGRWFLLRRWARLIKANNDDVGRRLTT